MYFERVTSVFVEHSKNEALFNFHFSRTSANDNKLFNLLSFLTGARCCSPCELVNETVQKIFSSTQMNAQ